ncbi:D-2-hydroxyacid dehydrogenase [Paraburkholderia phenoliruptrix]|uniref:D-2-hydroxyacid dehydrogenase n=1 Tax=Paraburkholderia phenoliruptrix TaxID=252970 RepID=UPI002869B116|nr:D-2-hydroxyacid dehydrogenase [Paraburkholderia phenoliruptrix]WMY11772.1 D-2-hydroxyacid dehydrogenase [Paraburkholderia phenoliruptrix]
MHKIVFLDRETLAPSVRLRKPAFPHALVEYQSTTAAQTASRIEDASIVIVNKVRLDESTLQKCPNIKLIAVAATGTDCVDVAACSRRGILVTNIRGYAVNTVPEHTLALILALRRNVVAYRDDVLAGAWQKSGQFCFFDHRIQDLAGARIGIVGEGVLGSRVGELARSFGMDVVFAGHRGKAPGTGMIPWEEALRTSDIITLHCPLTAETNKLFSDAEFAAMQRKPIFVNTARGGLVDEEALERALESGAISGAGIDVTTQEPPAIDGPLMRVARRPNVILTPHVAWASEQAQQSLADQLVDVIDAFVAGTARNAVNTLADAVSR